MSYCRACYDRSADICLECHVLETDLLKKSLVELAEAASPTDFLRVRNTMKIRRPDVLHGKDCEGLLNKPRK